MNAEQQRLDDARRGVAPWKLWGPYLADRQWSTVREDYSANGDAWNYLPHDQARSRAYRWGEDGIAGLSDRDQMLCLAPAFWNEQDAILKERFFGLTNAEGNHGEDVKECYYYLDNTPTHAYMRMLYKYPQAEFPYAQLVEENHRRDRCQPEFELPDSGVFDEDRYFDITVEYAKAAPEDILLRLTLHNRGAQAAPLRVLPQIWFRNTWSCGQTSARPRISALRPGVLQCDHPTLGTCFLCTEGTPEFLFCENETNVRRLFGTAAPGPFKDGIHDRVVQGQPSAASTSGPGTKAAAHYALTVPGGQSLVVRCRLSRAAPPLPFDGFDATVAARRAEADAFYAQLQTGLTDADARAVQRQAFAGMLWSKQFYHFDIPQWLNGDPGQPPPPAERRQGRNREWTHLNNADVISMPDKWEYPWYASWDLAFHCIPLAMVDPDFAKAQLVLLTREWYMHPNGQLPAYEWSFGDVNPPVHAWAAWRVYKIDRKRSGHGDLAFLERVFHKLLLNFTWWVNRKDAQGNNMFQGGFLGLDNIGVFDRSAPLPTGGYIEQSDGTSWMAMYCLNMLRIALELTPHNPVYQDLATKFFEHFLYIAQAMTNLCGQGLGLWDEADQFYYDVLHTPDGRRASLKVRSMVGLIPLFAVETLEPELLNRAPEFARRMEWFLNYRPDLAGLVSRWHVPGKGERRLLSLLRGHRMKGLLRRMLDPAEFLSDYGVRALSQAHRDQPFEFRVDGHRFTVAYQPGESDSTMFGGNSNWRGPVWLPLNFLIIESLQKFHHYYGDDFKIECPVGSGRLITLNDAAEEIGRRLTALFLKDGHGLRPCLSACAKRQRDPNFRDDLLFHEYFHGDTGAGLGAEHQTGWTGLVAKLLHPRAKDTPSHPAAGRDAWG